MSEKPIREYDRFILRLPDGMRAKLQERAKANERSMNSEVVDILQSAMENMTDRALRLMEEDHARVTMRIMKMEEELAQMRDEADWMALQMKHIREAPVGEDGRVSVEDFQIAMQNAQDEAERKKV